MKASNFNRRTEKSILRIKKTCNFVILDKQFLQDPSLSCRAKGLLSYLLSKPDDWEIHLSELSEHFSDGKDSIRSGIDELERAGYIKKERVRSKNGKFAGVRYYVFETPELSDVEPQTDLPHTVSPEPVNPPLLSNDLTNIDTSYREDAKAELSAMSKNDCIKEAARLLRDEYGVDDEFKIAAALFKDAPRELDWHFRLWLLENMNEAIERATDRKKYIFSLLKEDFLWYRFMKEFDDDVFMGRKVLADVSA